MHHRLYRYHPAYVPGSLILTDKSVTEDNALHQQSSQHQFLAPKPITTQIWARIQMLPYWFAYDTNCARKLQLETYFCPKPIRNEASWFDATGGQFWAKSCEQFCRKVRLKSSINEPVILDSGLLLMHSLDSWAKCSTSRAPFYKTAHTILFKIGHR